MGKRDNKPAPIDQVPLTDSRRAQLLQVPGIGDDLASAYDAMRTLHDDMATAPTLYYWSLGQHCENIRRREAELAGGAGKVLVLSAGCRRLVASLGVCRGKKKGSELSPAGVDTMITLARNVFDAFPTMAALQGMLQARRADGQVISWGVIVKLTQPTVRADGRAALFDRARAENWTKEDAERVIDGGRAAATPAGADLGGRRVQPPKTIFGALHKWSKLVSGYTNYAKAVVKDEVVKSFIAGTDPDQLDPSTLKDCERVRAQLDNMITLARQQLAALDKVEAAVRAKLDPAPVAGPSPRDRKQAAKVAATAARKAKNRTRRQPVPA